MCIVNMKEMKSNIISCLKARMGQNSLHDSVYLENKVFQKKHPNFFVYHTLYYIICLCGISVFDNLN